MANYYYRWNRDGDHNMALNDLSGDPNMLNAYTNGVINGYTPLFTFRSTNSSGATDMTNFAASVKNS
jgi:hypothetical protein